ncbi:hypothetical protein OPT61_g8536 [Boeremia exigua]|uniref:Uncharacterized protein n=1 Tax=Boeremia exigua TaxID=749465 RepID=A0ACC2HXV1_9PLEO|nr:hypothetical protein OPT61_g8536 [Boeremia exigua]
MLRVERRTLASAISSDKLTVTRPRPSRRSLSEAISSLNRPCLLFPLRLLFTVLSHNQGETMRGFCSAGKYDVIAAARQSRNNSSHTTPADRSTTKAASGENMSKDSQCRGPWQGSGIGGLLIWRMSREEVPSPVPRTATAVQAAIQIGPANAKVRQQLQFALFLDPHTVLGCLTVMSPESRRARLDKACSPASLIAALQSPALPQNLIASNQNLCRPSHRPSFQVVIEALSAPACQLARRHG